MTYIGYDKLWRSEFYNNVSAKEKVRDINLNRSELKVNDTCKKDEKNKTIFEHSNDEDVINKVYLDQKLSKIEGQSSYIEKDYTELKHNIKKSVEENLIEKAVKTTIQLLYDKGLFDDYNHGKAYEVLKNYLLVAVSDGHRPDLEEVNDVVH